MLRTPAFVSLLSVLTVLGLGLSTLASPTALTVTPYADLVRFSGQGKLEVQVFSLAGNPVFSGSNQGTLDWNIAQIPSGVYLYAATVEGTKKKMGKVAVIRGQGQVAPPLITTPSVSDPNKVEPKWTLCANPCAEIHQGDITIQTTTGTSWAKFDSANQRLGLGTLTPNKLLDVRGVIAFFGAGTVATDCCIISFTF